MRVRHGTKLIAMKDTIREMVRSRNEVNATGFIADQSPSRQGSTWMTFLSQDTAVFSGTEKISRKFNYPVVYITVDRTKRGYYKIYGECLFENPKSTVDEEITNAHMKKLEENIIKKPEIWLWSHRRWKHKR